MIEINLIPDVKEELLRARRLRNTVITFATFIGAASIGVMVLLLLYVFGGQTVRGIIVDTQIKDEDKKLQAVTDLGKTLTIQNQLKQLSAMHADKHMTSRIFDLLSAIVPKSPNNVTISNFELDTETNVITIKAQALNGYPALEVFKKTIKATNFEYDNGAGRQSVPLASDLSDTDRSYGEDSSGRRVLRFTVSFTYPAELLSPASENAKVVGPSRRNVTDSYLGVPTSLFSARGEDISEEQ